MCLGLKVSGFVFILFFFFVGDGGGENGGEKGYREEC